jgi:hypothetical protein
LPVSKAPYSFIWRPLAFLYTASVLRFSRLGLLLILLVADAAFAANKAAIPTIRWTDGAGSSTFREGDDGRYYYGLAFGDFEVTLAVDRQELEKIPHRSLPMLGVFLTLHYKGGAQFEVQQNRFTLEFVKHFQVVKSSFDPDGLQKRLQDDIDDVTDQVERHDVKKHPEQKEQKETELQARLKDYTEMMDFISTRALRPTTLDASNSSASGWVFFPIRDKWIGPWRKPEQFILRLPVENLIVEFPFLLPPQPGKVLLRKRPEE